MTNSAQNNISQWLTATMRANPNAHPDWVISQVARRCKTTSSDVAGLYAKARKLVGDSYKAAPMSYQPAARLQASPAPSIETASAKNPFAIEIQPTAPSEIEDDISPQYITTTGNEADAAATPFGSELQQGLKRAGLQVANIGLEKNGIPESFADEAGKKTIIIEMDIDSQGYISRTYVRNGGAHDQAIGVQLVGTQLSESARPGEGTHIVSVEVIEPASHVS